ncbi:hypothetical protein O181_027019 [Austropuccinia psidii MF-1]|uniref:Uncharacterized protein n=1 Tax=Austropuccinia psidii MF-1 TaxID=1389203 RepID=A0A9Q3CL39_9BASI|nr:hypothetical protein [Austropuccinia psidii MF-1]
MSPLRRRSGRYGTPRRQLMGVTPARLPRPSISSELGWLATLQNIVAPNGAQKLTYALANGWWRPWRQAAGTMAGKI